MNLLSFGNYGEGKMILLPPNIFIRVATAPLLPRIDASARGHTIFVCKGYTEPQTTRK